MFLLVPAYPGCPGSKAVKRSLLLLSVVMIVVINGTSHCGLIMIHHFPLSSITVFHSHRFLPIPIRGYYLQTLFTLPWLPYISSPTPFSLLPPSSLPTPAIYAYNMPIQLIIYAYTAATHDAITVVSSCWRASVSTSVRPTWNTTP